MHRCKKHRLILLLFFVVAFTKINAQSNLIFNTVDSISYNLYEKKEWKELSRYSRLAFSSGYDYYYLRMRAGIADFEQKKFRAAIEHFNIALALNSGDETAQEYLYLCYLYTGRTEDARWLSRSFSPAFASYMKTTKLLSIDLVMAEGGTKISDSTKLFNNAVFSQVGLNHYVSRRLSLFHSVNFYTQKESRFNLSQYQYYLNSGLPLKHDLFLTAGAHLLYSNVDYTSYISEVVTSTAVVRHMPPPPPVGAPPPNPPPRPFETVDTFKYTNYRTLSVNKQSLQLVASVNLKKQWALFDILLGGTANLLDTVKQLQLNTGLVIYPFKNNRLAIGSYFYPHTEDAFKNFDRAYLPFVSFFLLNRFGLNVAYFYNSGLNIAEQSGYLVNNSYDNTTGRLIISPSCSVTQKIHLYSTFAYETKLQKNDNFSYHYTIISLGIKYTPF